MPPRKDPAATAEASTDDSETSRTQECGLVMPISEIDGCSEKHWLEVEEVLKEAASRAGYSARLVSDSNSNVVIQKSIVHNLYKLPIVICDVSAKNPNVMFEFGMRVSFDKPIIVVKDDKTSFSFDTAPFRHIIYPRDMNFAAIKRFIIELSETMTSYLDAAKSDNHEGYLKTFGAIESIKLDKQEIVAEKFILNKLSSLEDALINLSREMRAIDRENYIRSNIAINEDVLSKEQYFGNLMKIKLYRVKNGVDMTEISSMMGKYGFDNNIWSITKTSRGNGLYIRIRGTSDIHNKVRLVLSDILTE